MNLRRLWTVLTGASERLILEETEHRLWSNGEDAERMILWAEIFFSPKQEMVTSVNSSLMFQSLGRQSSSVVDDDDDEAIFWKQRISSDLFSDLSDWTNLLNLACFSFMFVLSYCLVSSNLSNYRSWWHKFRFVFYLYYLSFSSFLSASSKMGKLSNLFDWSLLSDMS